MGWPTRRMEARASEEGPVIDLGFILAYRHRRILRRAFPGSAVVFLASVGLLVLAR